MKKIEMELHFKQNEKIEDLKIEYPKHFNDMQLVKVLRLLILELLK